MFILETNTAPETLEQLTDAITRSLKKSIQLSNPSPVQVTGQMPNLTQLTVDLSNTAVFGTQPLPDKAALSNVTTGPTAEAMTITGKPIRVSDIPLQVQLDAQQIHFDYAHTSTGQIMAIPREAQNGRLNIAILRNHLDNALLLLARKFSASHGVEITKVESTLVATTPTNLSIKIKVTAKKFMTAVIEINGQVQIDDRMRLTATNLKASSTGMVGNVAVGILQPQLNKLEGHAFPLLKYSLGNLKLRGVTVDTTDGLSLSASFGSETK